MSFILSVALYSSQTVFLKSSLIILYMILAALALSCLVFTFITIRSQLGGIIPKVLLVLLYLVTFFVLISAILCTGKYKKLQATNDTQSIPQATVKPFVENTDTSPTAATTGTSRFSASHVTDTNPANWNIKWHVMRNSTVLDSYTHLEEIKFDDDAAYTALEGIITFRGNNYRDSASYGTADIVTQTITEKWRSEVGSFNSLSGCGWTGQPIIVRWDNKTKTIMNLYAEKKAKTDLAEVIYPTLDGHIYFYDLDDGSYTRDPINVEMNLKGSGSLDPRGYPLLYVSSGDSTTQTPRIFIISLIEGKIIYEQSGSDIDAYRHTFTFNSSPLVDAETDTLIWPAESGILYFIKLNTEYSNETGTLAVNPENQIKLRYKTDPAKTVGTDASTIIVENNLYYTDNSGMFLCVDMRTMELAWAQDTNNDIDATPVFQWGENGEGYIYTGTSAGYTNRTASIQKLNALTGEILWDYSFDNIATSTNVSGGIHSSPVLGKPGTNLEGMIIYCVAGTPSSDRGLLVALDTQTGQLIWEQELDHYTWSSPVAVYTDDGIGYFVLCDSNGTIALRDGTTGNLLNSIEVGSTIEASPAVFENTVVVGSLGEHIFSFSLE